jgi:hypothetical protein
MAPRKRSVGGSLMPQLSVCTRKWGLIRSIIPCPGRPSRNALMKFDRSLGTLTPGIPASAERATVEGTDHLLWLTGHSPSSAATIEVIGQTLQDRLSRLAPATSWAVTHVLVTDDGSAIAAAIREGRCVSVSDGSFKDQYGTSAWAIEAESSVDRCTGKIFLHQ